MPASPSLLIFLGTYTPAGGASRGIYSVRLDPATGALSEPVFVAAASNPTFLAWHPDGKTLYALTESGTVGGKPGGALAAFRRNADGTLALLNIEPAGSLNLSHVNVDGAGRVAAVISYSGGQLASFPLAPDGSLGPRASLVTHQGPLGPNAKRQEKPHPHSITFAPDNRFLYVCDLGLDRVFRYRFDPATATLTGAGEFATAPGAGPRHSKFSADGRFLYVINELNSTIAPFAVDPATGDLAPLPAVSTLPPGFTGESICAEIRLSPDGRFVYGSNRGHDSLAVFARDAAQGTLTPVEIVPSGGKHPRNFNLSPDGRWLVCANRDTDNVTVFRVDPATGRLTPTGPGAKVPQAVCVLFAPTP
jgi:6-phosphogluconolactonase